jgi:hypothetical protein
MERVNISQDDIQDVSEMSKLIEMQINEIVKDNAKNLAISAIITASINSILSHCQTIEDVVFFRNLFVKLFDTAQIKKNN